MSALHRHHASEKSGNRLQASDLADGSMGRIDSGWTHKWGVFFVTWGAKLSNIVRVGTFYLTVKEEVGVISRAGTRTITLRIHSEYIDLKLTLIFTSCDSYACPKVLGIYNPPRARFLCSARMVAPLGKLFFPSLYHPILTSHHRVST